MGEDKGKDNVVRVFERRKQKMDPGEAFNITPFLIAIIVCLTAFIVSVFIGYSSSRTKQRKIVALEERAEFLEKKALHLHEMIGKASDAISYGNKLGLKGVVIERSDQKITLTGMLINNGKRTVHAPDVTVYFLNADDETIGSETVTLDEEIPVLNPGQGSKFGMQVNAPPGDIKEIFPAVTSFGN